MLDTTAMFMQDAATEFRNLPISGAHERFVVFLCPAIVYGREEPETQHPARGNTGYRLIAVSNLPATCAGVCRNISAWVHYSQSGDVPMPTPGTAAPAVTLPIVFDAALTRQQVEAHERDLMGNPRGYARRVAMIALTYDATGLRALMRRTEENALGEMLDLITEHKTYCKAALELADAAFARFLSCGHELFAKEVV